MMIIEFRNTMSLVRAWKVSLLITGENLLSFFFFFFWNNTSFVSFYTWEHSLNAMLFDQSRHEVPSFSSVLIE